MYFFRVKQYLAFRKKAVDEFGLHSPFLFDLYSSCFKPRFQHDFPRIKELRNSLSKNKTSIKVKDFGVGSKVNKSPERTVSEMYKSASVSKKQGELFNRMVRYFDFKIVLELGTHLGVSGSYFLENTTAHLFTIEGCAETQVQAKKNLKQHENRITYIKGEFRKTLQETLNNMGMVDLAYIDGNHDYENTLWHYQLILDKTHENSIILLDDINWSPSMAKVWETIIERPEISISVNCFKFGILFFKKGIEKQNFSFKF